MVVVIIVIVEGAIGKILGRIPRTIPSTKASFLFQQQQQQVC